MPHVPDSQHDSHDLELIAASAAGELTGDDQERAAALVAGCSECAVLVDDIRLIAAALPTLPVPARPRDFRLTPGQAASLQPRGWTRFAATLASPRFSRAAPLGTVMAALGLVAVLVAGGGLPSSATAPTGAASAAGAPVAGDGATPGQEPAPQRALTGNAGTGPAAPSAAPSGASALELAPEATTGPADGAASDTDVAAATTDAMSSAPTSSFPPLLIVGIVLLIGGIVLVAARLIATRLARAP